MFPTDIDAYEDMMKLVPTFGDAFSPSKQLYDATPENAIKLIKERVGWSSTFGNPHESDQIKNPTLFQKLYNGISLGDLEAECIKAARDFEVIKDGTARTGALGLSFIFSRKPEQKHLMNDAMELYHILAQNTLDAKAGIEQPSLDVVSGISNGNEELVKTSLEKLGYDKRECIDALLDFGREMKSMRGRMRYLTSEFPVLSIIQRGAGKEQACAVSRRVVNDTNTGNGVWEVLLDFLLGRGENSVYDWKQDTITKSNRLSGYTELLKRKWHV